MKENYYKNGAFLICKIQLIKLHENYCEKRFSTKHSLQKIGNTKEEESFVLLFSMHN